ncbi:MAG TPA: folate-binding protein [Candidatus Saccharimonadia bacterium]|nr:folate-binding protein [Candidatus Saccharimonadia bacterium]
MLTLRGQDALAFAQAQLASDVAAMPDASWRWSACLSPQGRAIAVMPVVRHTVEALDLLVPAARGPELAARLQRFVFRTRVALAVRPGFPAHAVAGEFAAARAIDGMPDAYRIPLAPGFALVVGEPANEDLEDAWRAHLVGTGVALLAGAAVEAHTGHALGLDALEAISTNKGCYPGQEIVARMHFLGRNKRHLCRFAVEAGAIAPEPGAAIVRADGTPAADVVLSLNLADGGVGGLAVAHEHALVGEAAFRVGGDEATLVRMR